MASSCSASLSLPPVKKDEVTINWAELPPELMTAIMLRLDVIEKLESAQKVCTSWRRVCIGPSLWRKIDMRNLRDYSYRRKEGAKLTSMCRRAVDLSQGGLLEIKLQDFGSDDLLTYISDRSGNLRSLELADCPEITGLGISKAVMKLPLLEELNVSYFSTKEHHLKAIGQACPNLKTLKLNCMCCRSPRSKCDEDALAIAETMPGLLHLELFGNRLSSIGLYAILDNCSHLEHLDLRRCFYVKLVGDLEKRCFERIKDVRPPNDSTDDYYVFNSVRSESSSDSDSDDYGYGSDDSIESSEYIYHVFPYIKQSFRQVQYNSHNE